jgi:hypothetical protein
MPYIGNDLATQFQAFATQTITGDGSTGYTLDRAVANGKELLVYINNVKQEEGSGKAYTASGTTITFSEAVASGDSCYLVYMGSAQQTVTAPDGSIVSGQIANAELELPNNLKVIDSSNLIFGTGSDAKIFHDGNNTKFQHTGTGGLYVGADTFAITNGATDTNHISIDSNGHVTMPKQSAFMVTKSSEQNNITSGQEVTINFDSERFDQNADFASNTFTAPVTGRYQLNIMIDMTTVDSASAYYYIDLVTSNRRYRTIVDPDYGQDNAYLPMSINVLADMDASDTAYVIFAQASGASQTNITTHTFFSGYLAC